MPLNAFLFYNFRISPRCYRTIIDVTQGCNIIDVKPQRRLYGVDPGATQRNYREAVPGGLTRNRARALIVDTEFTQPVSLGPRLFSFYFFSSILAAFVQPAAPSVSPSRMLLCEPQPAYAFPQPPAQSLQPHYNL